MVSPSTPSYAAAPIPQSEFPSNVKACDRNLGLALCLSKTHKLPAGITQQISESHAKLFTKMK